MENLNLGRCALSVWVAATLLAGCGGSPAQVEAPGAMPQAKMPPPASEHRYVINYSGNDITVYNSGAEHPELTISQGIDGPTALAFDTSDNLYVANAGNNTVTVYANGSNVVKRTISTNISDPQSLLFVADELYVADFSPPAVTVYSTTGKYLSSFPKVVEPPLVLAANSSGTVFVANQPATGHGTVTVYNSSKNTLERTITDGIYGPHALALDGSGDLYVANYFGWTVTEYAPGSEKFFRQITNGIAYPNALALDGSDNLYVESDAVGASLGSVTVYAPGSTNALRYITDGIYYPNSLAFGPSGFLNVANTGGIHGSITGYAAGSGKVAWTVTDGIDDPIAVTFGP